MIIFYLKALDLGLKESIHLVSAEHPSAKNRCIYINGKIQTIEQNFFKKQDLMPRGLAYYIFKESWAKRRPKDVEDESIYDFVSRRIGSDIAENLADPFIKGKS
jgi:protoporphyrinogen/coproporphyrinogen III oxidase